MGYLYPLLSRDDNGGSTGKGGIIIGMLLAILVIAIIVLVLIK